jgi:hypothetical protein
MAVTWGTWRYGNIGQSSANGMRLGMEVTGWSAVNSSSASITVTVDIWTENQYTHSGDSQRLNYSTNIGSDNTYTNNSGGSPVKRATRTAVYNYPAGSYGSSPGTITLTAELTEHYWDDGTNPTISISPAVPARPGGVPTGQTISATANVGSISVSWSATGDPGVTSYSVYRNNDAAQLLSSDGSTSLTDNVGNGVSAYYVMYAYNAAGNSAAAVSGTVTTPTVPGTPSVTATAGIRQITVTFPAPSDGGSGITSYNYSLDNVNWSGAISSGHVITGLANGTTYTVYVRANNAVGSSGSGSASATTPALPSTPTGLSADATTFGAIGLSWTASSGSGYTVTYTIARDGTTLGTTTSTTFNDSTVAPYTAYTYTVTAGTSVGSSGAASVSVTSMGGIAKVWNGTSYVVTLPKVWNGTTWIDAQARMWNGTEWKHGI